MKNLIYINVMILTLSLPMTGGDHCDTYRNTNWKPKISNILESLDQQVVDHMKREEANFSNECKARLAEACNRIDARLDMPAWMIDNGYILYIPSNRYITVPDTKHTNTKICRSQQEAINCIQNKWQKALSRTSWPISVDKIEYYQASQESNVKRYVKKLNKYGFLVKRPNLF